MIFAKFVVIKFQEIPSIEVIIVLLFPTVTNWFPSQIISFKLNWVFLTLTRSQFEPVCEYMISPEFPTATKYSVFEVTEFMFVNPTVFS